MLRLRAERRVTSRLENDADGIADEPERRCDYGPGGIRSRSNDAVRLVGGRGGRGTAGHNRITRHSRVGCLRARVRAGLKCKARAKNRAQT